MNLRHSLASRPSRLLSYDGDLMERIAWRAARVHDALSQKPRNARDEP
jgi:hypothetical protein